MKKQKTLTGNETVKEVLMSYITDYISDAQKAKEIFETYVTEHKDYIEWVLDRKCKEKWAHCQMSFMILDRIILNAIKL